MMNTDIAYIVVWARLYITPILKSQIIESKIFTGSTAEADAEVRVEELKIDPNVLHRNIDIFKIRGRNISIDRMLSPTEEDEYMVKKLIDKTEVILQKVRLRKYGRGLPQDVLDVKEFRCKVIEQVDVEKIQETLDYGAIPPWGWAMDKDETIYKLFVDNSVEIDLHYPKAKLAD